MKKIMFLLSILIGLNAFIASGEGQEEGLSQVYKAYLVCNGHLDTQWNWDVQTTINEFIPRLMLQNLYIMDRYPEYRFSFEGGIKYSWMKEYYPLYYAKIKERIASGQWHVAGSSWDANDTHVPSTESAFRNILLGQEFYKKEFGLKSDDIFLPDCFGFGYTLPSVAAHCGLIGMSTQKIGWRRNVFFDAPYHKKNPFSWGVWYGIDGNSVIAALDTGGYNEEIPEDVQNNKKLMARAANGFDNTCYRYYSGVNKNLLVKTGDRGPTGTVLTSRRLKAALADKDAPIQIISAVSNDLYHDYMDRRNELPTYDGELLMDVHGVGCFTSQTAMKYYNRRNEELAGAAERASVAADWAGAYPYDGEKLNEIWKRFIWHQFHDDLTGTSIPSAYRWSWNDELLCLRQSTDVMSTAVSAFSTNLDTRTSGIPVVVYNAVGSKVTSLVEATIEIDAEMQSALAYGPDGKSVPVQILEREGSKAKVIFSATVPSAGYAVYDIRPSRKTVKGGFKVGANSLENKVYKVTLNSDGDIASIVDKRNGKDLVEKGKAFRLAILGNNIPDRYPAWEIKKETLDGESHIISDNVKISVAENGPVRASLRVERTYGTSRFVQYVCLTNGAEDYRIDVRNEIDWDTEESLLKAEFPMSVSNPKAKYDLGLGYIERGNNTEIAYEVPGQKWADLTSEDGSYGVSILNNCKYGWDKPSDNTLRLTLIHTPGVKENKANPNAPKYPHQQHLDKGINKFTYSIIGHAGQLGTLAYSSAESLNMPLLAYSSPKHSGKLGKSFSMVSSTNPALGIRAFKKAEDGDGYIVRFYNLTNKDAKGNIIFPSSVVSAEECNGIEERIGDASVSGNMLSVSAGKFAPKTYRVRLENSSLPKPAVKSEEIADLPYNNTVFTTDEFYTFYMFDKDRGTYAAELLPETLTCRGVPFRLGEENTPDAILCSGQTIKIPQGYKKLYMLVAGADEAGDYEFTVGGRTQMVHVPLWKGHYGQWGWRHNSEAFLKNDVVAHIGSHKHKGDVGNLAYEFSYMYRVELDVPEGAESVTLPDSGNVAVFAITASDGTYDNVKLLTETFISPDENIK